MHNLLSSKTIEDLLSLQNVVGIGYGLKQVKGLMTQDEAIVILVETKVPLSELPENQVIPKMVEGKISDVIEVGQVSIQDALPNK